MYVCLCNAIKDSELQELAHGGIFRAEDAYRALGVEMSCETCIDYVQEVIDEVRAAETTA